MNTFIGQRRRVRLGLAVLFGLLLTVSVFLLYFSYSQLRYESFFVQRNFADAFIERVNTNLATRFQRESNRPISAYSFLLDGTARFNQRSPLSDLSVDEGLPGTLGYFQVDAAGKFSTPLLPQEDDVLAQAGFTDDELAVREQRSTELRRVLSQTDSAESLPEATDETNNIEEIVVTGARRAGDADASDVDQAKVDVAANQQIYAALSKTERPTDKKATYVSKVGRVDELKLKEGRLGRQETTGDAAAVVTREAPAPVAETRASFDLSDTQRDSVFADSFYRFRMTILDPEYLAFHRDVWLGGERRIQGFVVEMNTFVQGLLGSEFYADPLSLSNDLVVGLNNEVVTILSSADSGGYELSSADVAGNEIIVRRRLVTPADQFELIVNTQSLPAGAGLTVLVFSGALLLLLLVVGYLMLSRLMHRSIDLAQQQQDFVSAVTHELKTPLTSIRMYGEILRAGWANEDKKRSYYDFIFHESERLSRLINNVLQLGRITHGADEALVLQDEPVTSLIERVEAAATAQFEHSEFSLELNVDAAVAQTRVPVDADAFQQVMLNLLDNALKFAHDAQRKVVMLGARKHRNSVDFYVRDFGPGVPKEKMKKIFELFYRGEDEITRETTGTGIGLSLVAELVEKMGGEIDVINREPGAEFIVRLEVAD